MKKKNLAVLLVIPFLISLLGIVTINTAFHLIENDINSIYWEYSDFELFKVNEVTLLEAEGVTGSKYPAGAGNELVWTVTNKDATDRDVHAEIVTNNGKYYLKAQSEGNVVITCSNAKGNVFRSMNGIIYENSAIAVNTVVASSQSNIDSTLYYGEYDLKDGVKRRAEIAISMTVAPAALRDTLMIAHLTDNVVADIPSGTVSILGSGDAQITFASSAEDADCTFTMEFNVVKDGVNVYTYDDLLFCTNRSEKGEIAVLRKSFESMENTYRTEGGQPVRIAGNIELFGNYDFKTGKYSFADEAYSFRTTYNSEYIRQWNQFAAANPGYNAVGDSLYAGLRVQKDFYGNGYTVNMHNLCFPTAYVSVVDSATGEVHEYYKPGAGDLFRGPLSFFTLGSPNGSTSPLITAYGQDNVGMYIDGDNVTVNDVKIKNCDFGNIIANLDYVGTVAEVNGDNVTVKNSVLSNGKNVLRSFSSMDLTVANCMLSTARNFLFTTGSNEYIANDLTDTVSKTFTVLNGTTVSSPLYAFLQKDGEGDAVLNSFVSGDYKDKAAVKKSLRSIQTALNAQDAVEFKGSTTVTDCKFYRSGIASIGLETLFNGPFLYCHSPSMIGTVMDMLNEISDVIPMIATNVSGTSYPVRVTVAGSTRFYDYKNVEEWDISGLIDQHITEVANSLGILDSDLREITIDDIFPLKNILTNVAASNGCVYTNGGKRYINIPVAYYGGGLNLSELTIEGAAQNGVSKTYSVDLLDSYLGMQASTDDIVRFMQAVLTKTVTAVTGFEPFRFDFVNDSAGLFDEQLGKPTAPDYRDLINNSH